MEPTEKIKHLYDGFAARFKFFRQIIDLMWDFARSLGELENERHTEIFESKKLRARVQVLEDRVLDLMNDIDTLKEKAPEKKFRSRTEILDGFHKAINPTE